MDEACATAASSPQSPRKLTASGEERLGSTHSPTAVHGLNPLGRDRCCFSPIEKEALGKGMKMSKARLARLRPRPTLGNRGASHFGCSKYRSKAWECAARAQSVNDPERRAELLQFSGMWLSLTEPAEDNFRGAYEWPPRSWGHSPPQSSATLPALGRTDPCRDQLSFQGRSGPAKLFPDRALPVRRSTVLDRDRSELREAGADKSG